MEQDEIIQWLEDHGYAKRDPDGTWSISEEVKQIIEELIEEDPTWFKKIFPDRMN